MSTPETSGVGRRTQLRRRRRRRRLQLVTAAVALLVALAVAFAVYLAADAPEPPAPDGEPPRTQRTLLLQVQGPDSSAVASALVARDPEQGDAGVLLVPPQVLVTVPGSGSLPFGRALAQSTPEGSRNALSDLLGVTVDDGWVLPTAGLAALVDALGGITVDVDVPVVQGTTVLLGAGAQPVDGARAVQFATFLASGEQEQARLARVQEVLDGVVQELPEEAASLVPLLQPTAAGSTLPAPELAELLVGVAAADGDGALQYDSLPVIPIDTGAGVAAFRVDAPRLTTVVDRLFAASVPPGVREGGNRVLVLNGVGTPGLGERVRARLTPAGFVFVGSRNAPSFGYSTTQILVPEATPQAQALGERVREALGVPGAQIGTQEFGTVADVVVVVGRDFTP